MTHIDLTAALTTAVKVALHRQAQPLQDRLEQLEPEAVADPDYDVFLARIVGGDDGAIAELIELENRSSDLVRAQQIRAEAATILRQRIHSMLNAEGETMAAVGRLAAAMARMADQAAGLRRQGREIKTITPTAEATLGALRQHFDRLAPLYQVQAECRALFDHVEAEWLDAAGQQRAA